MDRPVHPLQHLLQHCLPNVTVRLRSSDEYELPIQLVCGQKDDVLQPKVSAESAYETSDYLENEE